MSRSLKSPPELRGVAGYVTPYPYLDRLQERMEERLARKVPAAGRFCGFCYCRLREIDPKCPICGTETASRSTVAEIPQSVLKAYKAKASTEARSVYTGAFFGLILASALFIILVLWGPGLLGHPAFAFAVLILGGYLLAQLFGPLIFAQVGYRSGAKKRDRLWARYLAERDGPVTQPPSP